MNHIVPAVLSLIWLAKVAVAADLGLPERATNSLTGSQFVREIDALSLAAREARIGEQVLAGNVPDFWRSFVPVTFTNVVDATAHTLTFFVSPDYLAVGSDADYFLAPLSPETALRLAGKLGCTLPTPKLVNEVWRAATVRLIPAPMTPDPNMVTVPRFAAHNALIQTQRLAQVAAHPLGALVAGHKKDVVITARLEGKTNRVAIYGWHKPDGTPIQPLYLGHAATWVDYSHGIRFVRNDILLDGKPRALTTMLADPNLSVLVSDDGTIALERLILSGSTGAGAIPPVPTSSASRGPGSLRDFRPTGSFAEWSTMFNCDPEVRVLVNAPALTNLASGNPVRLVLYALPNGNTIEQTIGRQLQPGDDWHFNIQHIGAQTRWLRRRLTNEVIVVAYLESAMKSWPAWRRKHGDSDIPRLIGDLKNLFPTNRLEVVLTGHSGGGSLTFGYLNAVEHIPEDVTRIAFLDSNYAYQTTNHLHKLVQWLKSPTPHVLCVLAYQDYLGLLDGKPFVSPSGGTWGRSQAMLSDLRQAFDFTTEARGEGLSSIQALDGRIGFWLKENPERKILHTVQVEKNGFLHSELQGSNLLERDYVYLGDRTYESLIEKPD